jgi:hypothetical protein
MSNNKNEVSAPGAFTKDNVPALLEAVQKKIADLKSKFGSEDSALSNDDLGQPFGHISSIDNVPMLIRAISSVRGRESAYKSAIAETDKSITLTKFPFKVCNTSANKVVDAINRRIGEVTFKDEITKLEKAAKLLNQHTSEEQRFNNDMAEFAGMF